MYQFYVDETYYEVGGRKIFVLGGIVIPARYKPELQAQFWSLKEDERFGLSRENPIKWNPPQGKEEYKAQRSVEDQNDLKMSVLHFIAQSNSTIIAAVIDSRYVDPSGYYDDDQCQFPDQMYHYYCAGVEMLAQRLQYSIQDLESSSTKYTGKGYLILDYPGREKESALASFFRKRTLRGAKHDVSLTHLNDSLEYDHCRCCDCLQMADFVIGAIGHYAKSTGNNRYFRIIKNTIRTDRRGRILGYGVVVYPRESPLTGLFDITVEPRVLLAV